MPSPDSHHVAALFTSSLGWMALAESGRVLRRLAMAHTSARSALVAVESAWRKTRSSDMPEDWASLDETCCDEIRFCRLGPNGVVPLAGRFEWHEALVERLRAYASGDCVEFSDVQIDVARLTPFRRRVTAACRAIRYGETLTYGELAAAAGSPRAARAVGSCMAANRYPLIVPCHRVVAAGGRLGDFSAPGGVATKRRLLAMETASR